MEEIGGGAPTIGDNVYIGPGAKFLAQFILEIMLELGQIVLCLKMCQINATVVLPKPRIIIKSPDYQYYVANPNDWNAQGE